MIPLIKKRKFWAFIVIVILLSCMPFLWFSPGEIDIGGDSGRLYLYQPFNYLTATAFYPVLPVGTGTIAPSFYYIPYVGFLEILLSIIKSPYLLNGLMNVIKLTGGFIAIYLIIKELAKYELITDNTIIIESSGILAGLFYVFSPAMISNYQSALLTHNQVFLNPLIFYFLLKYILSKKYRYFIAILISTLLFSPNFSYTAAPPFFAFYPLAALFLFCYTIFVTKKKIPYIGLLLGVMLFFLLHAFHLIPELTSLFNPSTNINMRVFNTSGYADLLNYFYGVLGIPKLSYHFFAYTPTQLSAIPNILFPLVIISSFLLKKKIRTLLLIMTFFLVVYYLTTAKVSEAGVIIYRNLFAIPGFGMFRNYYGQWQFVYYFFYSLLFGCSLLLVLEKLSKRKQIVICICFLLAVLLIANSFYFLNGRLVKVQIAQNNTTNAVKMDPRYERMLEFIRRLPNDGKILTLPLTDCCFQVIHGTNNGAYMGVSTIAYLTGKKDFSGYANLAPFSDNFLQIVHNNDFESLERLFGLLNIKYIFYNSDPLIYDSTFPDYPYSQAYIRKFLPKSQMEYKAFLANLELKKIYQNGPFQLYEIKNKYFLPHIYPVKHFVFYSYLNEGLTPYNSANDFFPKKLIPNVSTAYISSKYCNDQAYRSICADKKNELLPDLTFTQINPAQYMIHAKNMQGPFMLVFSDSYDKNWRLYSMQSNKELAENSHILVNGYANGWLIDSNNPQASSTLIIEYVPQRIFYIGILISAASFLGLLMWGLVLFKKNHAKV